jgi:hypothetical protein
MVNTSVYNKDKLPIIIFLVLILFITLFPPFSWGDERLITEKERNKYYNDYRKQAYEIFPIKQYDFIFSNSKKEITSDNIWGWEDYKSVKAKFLLSRHLIISELIINYLLATLVSLIIFVLSNKTFNKHQKESN